MFSYIYLHHKVFTGLGKDLGGQTQLLKSLPASESFPIAPLSARLDLDSLIFSNVDNKISLFRQEVTDSLCIHGVATLEREPASPAQVVARFARCWFGNIGAVVIDVVVRCWCGKWTAPHHQASHWSSLPCQPATVSLTPASTPLSSSPCWSKVMAKRARL